MKNVKLISMLLALLMLSAVLFAACSGEGELTTAEPETTVVPDPTEAPETTAEAPLDTTAPESTTEEPVVTTEAPVTDPPHVHEFGALNTVKAATCTEEGLAEKVCACGVKESVTIEKIAHRAGEWVIDKEATATEEGSKSQPCAVCGTILKTEVIPVTPHTPGEWIIDKEATCTEDGSKHRVCTKCGETSDTEVIPAKGHTEVVDAAKAATCTEKGLTEGKHCSVCNTVITAQKDIAAKGHKEVTDAAKVATCTEKGLTEGKHCSVCNTVITAQNDIPAKGHTEVVDAAKAATCTEKGLTEGKHCSVCNTVITAQQDIPAKGHTDGEWIVDKEATTSATGSKHQVCSVCGATLKTETIPVIDPLKIDYSVTVLDGFGNPMSGIQVTFMSPQAPVGSVKTDENGKAVCKLTEGEYEADVEVGDDYYVGGYIKLTASAPSAEVIAVGYASNPEKMYPDEVNGVYNVGVGSVRVPVENNVIRYFFFKPTEGAVYKFYTDSDKVEAGYYGGNFNVLAYNAGQYDEEGNLVFEFLKSSVGQVLVIGLKSSSASVSECTLTIERYSDIGISDGERPYEQYQLSKELTQKTQTPKGTREYVSIEVDLTTFANREEIQVVYNEADGYYHLHTADGPVLYVVITQPLTYFQDNSLAGIAGTSPVGRIFYDEEGNFVKKEGYNVAIAGEKDYSIGAGEIVKNGYAQIADTKYGVVPLDADLIYILKNIGADGWYERGTPGLTDWIFGESIVMPENCWLFAVCYFIE